MSRGRTRSRPRTGEDGQAAAELVAVLPVLLVLFALVAQLAIAGWALWSTGNAARAGARAAAVGGDAERAALSALPGWLEREAEVEIGPPFSVRVRVPALVPGVPSIALDAATDLGPGER
jgi:hypothetical protein